MVLRKTARALAAAVALLSGPAAAREPAASHERGDECFWPSGGPKESRAAAQALVNEGNALLNQSIFVSAASKYREALKRCNHPALHYNLALALMNLDQPVEMYEHLNAAIQWGPEPIEKDRFAQAKNYATLLEKQLVRLRVRCDVPGAQVTFDGRPLLVSAGVFEGMVRPGFHTISASKEGMHTNEVRRQLEGGRTVALNLELKTEEELTEYHRRWPAWEPWALVGAGALVAAAGGGLQYFGQKRVGDFDARVLACNGCEAGPAREQGVRMQRIAIGAYGVGGAALAAGVVLAILNRAKPMLRPYDAERALEPPPPLALAPVFDAHGAGAAAEVQF
jgi:hypothetical protein